MDDLRCWRSHSAWSPPTKSSNPPNCPTPTMRVPTKRSWGASFICQNLLNTVQCCLSHSAGEQSHKAQSPLKKPHLTPKTMEGGLCRPFSTLKKDPKTINTQTIPAKPSTPPPPSNYARMQELHLLLCVLESLGRSATLAEPQRRGPPAKTGRALLSQP